MSTDPKEWVVIPTTPPYADKPEVSEAVRRAIGQRVGQCYRKDIYYTMSHAEGHARRMRENGLGDDMTAYKCPYCPRFHVGSKEKKERVDDAYRK